MGFIRALNIIKSIGFVSTISLLNDRLLHRRSAVFEMLRSHFQGIGLEIGGPSKVFTDQGRWPIYTVAQRIDNINFRDVTAWHGSIMSGRNFFFDASKEAGRQYICDAGNLATITDASYDFVLSSHMLEHSANPLRLLLEWKRVLKEGGILILVLPHKDGTFDHKRPITPLKHFVGDYENGTTEDDRSHFEEIMSLHDLSRDASQQSFSAFQVWINNNPDNRGAHHHVFSSLSAAKLVDLAGVQILTIEPRRPYDIFVAACKITNGGAPTNSIFVDSRALYLRRSPFHSDRLGLG